MKEKREGWGHPRPCGQGAARRRRAVEGLCEAVAAAQIPVWGVHPLPQLCNSSITWPCCLNFPVCETGIKMDHSLDSIGEGPAH